jgi:hypothetical protein
LRLSLLACWAAGVPATCSPSPLNPGCLDQPLKLP